MRTGRCKCKGQGAAGRPNCPKKPRAARTGAPALGGRAKGPISQNPKTKTKDQGQWPSSQFAVRDSPQSTPPPDIQGAGKTKSVTPVVGGWVRVRKRTRVRFIFLIFFYRVFELPSSRNAQKRDKNKSRKSRFGIFGRFVCKNFSTRFFCKLFFCSVFELPSLKNTRKRDKTKKVEENLTSKFLSKFLKYF
jgi:hypothetical protein